MNAAPRHLGEPADPPGKAKTGGNAGASDSSLHNPRLHALSVASLFALILLCIAWEWFLAPLRPGGSWLVLKCLPLLLPLRGLLMRDRYTMQWSSMLILLFFTEGIVRATSDRGPSALLAWCEVALTVLYFFATILYLRPYKRRARAASAADAGSGRHDGAADN